MIDRDTAIDLAKQAGFFLYDLHDMDGDDLGESVEADSFDAIERFAKLVEQRTAEAEREACASMLDARAASYVQTFGPPGIAASARFNECAAAIRARGTGGEG